MSTSVVANRIYARERVTAEDFREMNVDELLLRGCKPPTSSAGGIITAVTAEGESTVKDHPLRACVAFEVVKLPANENQTRGNPLNLTPGDVVLARNVLVDPLFGNELGITNLYTGVVGILERGPNHGAAPFSGTQRGEA